MDIPAQMSSEEEALWNEEETPVAEEEEAPAEEETPEEEEATSTEEEEEAPLEEEEETTSTEEEEEIEQPEEVTEDSKFEPLKAAGVEIPIDSLEELYRFASKGVDYTKKTQELAPWRKTISALEQNNMSTNDINLVIDAFNKDPDAITALLKRAGIDAMDIDMDKETEYIPNNHGYDEKTLALQETIRTLSADENFKFTEDVVDKQWDEESRKAIFDNPEYLAGLHGDVKSGLYKEVAPLALKEKLLDGSSKSDIEYYIQAGQKYLSQNAPSSEEVKEVVKEAKAQEEIKSKSSARKAATVTKNSSNRKTVTDYLDDDDDEAYNEWYAKMMSRQ